MIVTVLNFVPIAVAEIWPFSIWVFRGVGVWPWPMSLTFNYSHGPYSMQENQGQSWVGLKDRVETNGRAEERTRPKTLHFPLTRSAKMKRTRTASSKKRKIDEKDKICQLKWDLLCICAVLLVIIVIAASAVIICVTVVCIGCFCLSR